MAVLLSESYCLGKYNSGEIPSGSRLAEDESVKDFVWTCFFGTEDSKRKTLRVLNGLENLARDEGKFSLTVSTYLWRYHSSTTRYRVGCCEH
jgi:hypothetical protein